MPRQRFKLPVKLQRLVDSQSVAGFSYDPSTGAFAVTFHKPQPVQPDFAENTDSAEADPVDFRFALERFNQSPKARQ